MSKKEPSSIELIDAMYDYSYSRIKNKFMMNRKIESRAFTYLTFSGFEFILTSSLFSELLKNASESQKVFFISWRLLAIASIVVGVLILVKSLSNNIGTVKTVGINDVIEKKDLFKNQRAIFQTSMMYAWQEVSADMDVLITTKARQLRNGMWFLGYGFALWLIGFVIQSFVL